MYIVESLRCPRLKGGSKIDIMEPPPPRQPTSSGGDRIAQSLHNLVTALKESRAQADGMVSTPSGETTAHMDSNVEPLDIVVLDLNGVLCRKVYDRNRVLAEMADNYTKSDLALFVRPGAHVLLQTIMDKGWKLVFWSSAVRETVNAILSTLFPYVRPFAILSHEGSPEDKLFLKVKAGKNWSIMKDLSVLWSTQPGVCTPSRTIIVDDSWTKVRMHPENALLLPSFLPGNDLSVFTPEFVASNEQLMHTVCNILESAFKDRDVRHVLYSQSIKRRVTFKSSLTKDTYSIAALDGTDHSHF